MTSPYRLRDLRDTDGSALAALHRPAIVAVPSRFYRADELASWAQGIDPEGYARIAAGGKTFIVAETPDGAVAGFCDFRKQYAGAGEVRGLYTDPDHQGRGLGKRLLATAEAALAEAGAELIAIRASLSAVPFYVSQRYTEQYYELQKTRGGREIRVRWMRKELTA